MQSDLFYINATNDYTAINQQMMESRLLTVGNAWTAVSGDDYVFLANNHFLYEGKTEGKGILKFRVRLDNRHQRMGRCRRGILPNARVG